MKNRVGQDASLRRSIRFLIEEEFSTAAQREGAGKGTRHQALIRGGARTEVHQKWPLQREKSKGLLHDSPRVVFERRSVAGGKVQKTSNPRVF